VDDSKSILLVEDNADFRKFLATQLEARHFQVVELGDGTAARRFLEIQPFDTIVLDMNLPGTDGVEILKWLRLTGSESTVIMISASGEEVDRILCLELGADDFLVKPFSARELQARIRAVSRRRKPRSDEESPDPLAMDPSMSSDRSLLAATASARNIAGTALAPLAALPEGSKRLAPAPPAVAPQAASPAAAPQATLPPADSQAARRVAEVLPLNARGANGSVTAREHYASDDLRDRHANGSARHGYASNTARDGPAAGAALLTAGRIRLDPERQRCEVEGSEVVLTSLEFRLLLWFMRNLQRVFSRAQLLTAVWSRDYPGYEKAVNNHILRLRRKIGDDADEPRHIQTVHGSGYRFEP
jgi:DNA-binding response OmpR family regulator